MGSEETAKAPQAWTALLDDLVRLELKRGCQDDAAVGGFAQLALATVERARKSPAGLRLTDELRSLLIDYHFVSNSVRRERCQAVLALLERPSAELAVSGPDQATVQPARAEPPDGHQVSLWNLLDILEKPIANLRGVGPHVGQAMTRLGINSMADLLLHAPKGYLDLRRAAVVSRQSLGQMVLVKARLLTIAEIHRKVLLVKATARDPSGRIFHVVWFNNRFVKGRLQPGHDYDFYGRLENSFDGAQLIQPAFEESGTPAAQLHMNRIVPVYHLTAGLSQKALRTFVWRAVGELPSAQAEYLPLQVVTHFRLPDMPWSYRALHFPEDEGAAELARARFAFDSLFLFELKVHQRRQTEHDTLACPFKLPVGTVERFADALPFVPTASQVGAMKDIEVDVQKPRQMHRLLHGDVGSGKTAVAGYAAFAAATAGYQSAILSPTEILAEQTGRVLRELLGPLEVRVGVLTGGMTKAQRKPLLTALAVGDLDCLVGTHAILEEGVAFARLGLTVVDEQHRFGVTQRSALADKGEVPHSLVMSATPIPRTLALTIYGDLDISELPEKPAGRRAVRTLLVTGDERDRAYALLREQVALGRQAFVVVPAIDVSAEEGMVTASVTEKLKELAEGALKGLRIASLHGRMKSAEKEAAMNAFRARELDVLVATTVVEVGVDIPNAAVMVIEDAEKFGLATLHQLRGRVGRGTAESYCVLIQGAVSEEGSKRLQVLVDSDDGFEIAEEDLKLRGPGDILGTVQHGYDVPLFGSTSLLSYRDLSALPDIRRIVSEILARDPGLVRAEHRALARMLALRYPEGRVEVGEN